MATGSKYCVTRIASVRDNVPTFPTDTLKGAAQAASGRRHDSRRHHQDLVLDPQVDQPRLHHLPAHHLSYRFAVGVPPRNRTLAR
ncbi:hypothetical protein G6F40_016276 [Rhizopus arrhizus]|nr:hypothetical protein G6F40_016276 [Rhizopus arrhizus]